MAIATCTAPRDWWNEDDETLATALDVLNKQTDAVKAASRG